MGIYEKGAFKHVFGNRRAKAYLFSLVKFGSIAWLQAQLAYEASEPVSSLLTIVGYIWMGLLVLMFTGTSA